MSRVITKELALQIVKKLKATLVATRSKAHDIYVVEHEGQIVAHVSIRRGSKKDLGHDQIRENPLNLRVSAFHVRIPNLRGR